MNKKDIRMPDKLWSKIPLPNRSRWIRDAIKQRLARDSKQINDEYLDSLNNTSEQLRKVGTNLNQATRLLRRQEIGADGLPITEIIKAIKGLMTDVKIIKESYRDGS